MSHLTQDVFHRIEEDWRFWEAALSFILIENLSSHFLGFNLEQPACNVRKPSSNLKQKHLPFLIFQKITE